MQNTVVGIKNCKQFSSHVLMAHTTKRQVTHEAELMFASSRSFGIKIHSELIRLIPIRSKIFIRTNLNSSE